MDETRKLSNNNGIYYTTLPKKVYDRMVYHGLIYKLTVENKRCHFKEFSNFMFNNYEIKKSVPIYQNGHSLRINLPLKIINTLKQTGSITIIMGYRRVLNTEYLQFRYLKLVDDQRS